MFSFQRERIITSLFRKLTKYIKKNSKEKLLGWKCSKLSYLYNPYLSAYRKILFHFALEAFINNRYYEKFIRNTNLTKMTKVYNHKILLSRSIQIPDDLEQSKLRISGYRVGRNNR